MVFRLTAERGLDPSRREPPAPRPRSTRSFLTVLRSLWGELRMSIGTDAMKRQCNLWLQHKGELISARTTLLRAIGPESTEIHDALREDWTVVWPKGKPLLIGYHRAWPKKEVRVNDSVLSEKLFEAHRALDALIRDYGSAARRDVAFIADLPYEIRKHFRMGHSRCLLHEQRGPIRLYPGVRSE